MRSPTLSVTVPNYNYGRYLGRNIESILSQSYGDFELIVIDNASTDESVDIVRHYADGDDRIRLIVHPTNLGWHASYTESIDLCRGRYRVHVEADDWVIEGDAFEAQLDVLMRLPSVVFVYSSMTMTGSDDTIHHVSHPYDRDVVVDGPAALEGILTFNLAHTGMMMRADAMRAVKGYVRDFPHVADMTFGVQLCELGDVAYIDRQLYASRLHGENLHLRPRLDVVRREVLPTIDMAFDGPLGSRIPDRDAAQRRITRRALVHLPTSYIFSGERRKGWRLYWESLKARPVDTVLQPRTLSLLSRTFLGHRGHQWLQSQLRRARGAPSVSRDQRSEPERMMR